jgi:hypothetical protein
MTDLAKTAAWLPGNVTPKVLDAIGRSGGRRPPGCGHSMNNSIQTVQSQITNRYRRFYRALLVRRGGWIAGTPARSPRDIANYTTHSAFRRLAGLGPPKALGRPDIGPAAWFATLQGALSVAGPPPVSASSRNVFAAMSEQFPRACYSDPAFILKTGRVPDRTGQLHAFVVFGAPGTFDGGDCYYSGVKMSGRLVALTLFRRLAGDGLYKVVWAGVADGRDRRRSTCRAIQAHQTMISQYPELCIDFLGSITPAAARMGHSLFRRLRTAEMDRLRRLSGKDLDTLRHRVYAYTYPRFDDPWQYRPREVLGVLIRPIRHRLRAPLKPVSSPPPAGYR